jgi:hypothetical protein
MALLSAETLITGYLPDLSVDDDDAMARAARDLATVEQLAARWLGFPAAPVEPGGALVQSALESRAYVLWPRSRDGRRLVLRVTPMISIDSIGLSLSGDWPSDGSDPADLQEVTEDSYRLEPQQSQTILHRRATATLSIWPTEVGLLRVVCTAGFAAEDDLPAGVAGALYRTTADAMQRMRTRATNNVSQGGVSESLPILRALPPDVVEILAPYRLAGTVGVA